MFFRKKPISNMNRQSKFVGRGVLRKNESGSQYSLLLGVQIYGVLKMCLKLLFSQFLLDKLLLNNF